MADGVEGTFAPPVRLPHVTTVIPCFNGAPFIRRAIDSALAQSGAEVDVIVVDDASTDESAAIVRGMAQVEPRLRLVCLARNQGPAGARNAGIARAQGRYLAFLDADDYWLPAKLERQLAFMHDTDAALVYTGVDVRDARGKVLGRRHVPARVSAEQLLVHNVIAASSVLIDRTRVPPFQMPPLRMRQDLATWYALLRQGARAHGLDEPLIVYTKHAGSLSANKLRAAQANWRLYRGHLARPLPAAASLFARYASAALTRV